TAMFMGLCTAALPPAFIHGIISKRPSRLAATWSIIGGALGWLLWTVFAHTAESSALGICEMIFGVTTLAPSPLCFVDPLVIGTVISVVLLLVLLPFDKKRVTKEEQMALQ
ncbi:MAG TPA: sodium:solute symporter family protein, partial [Methanocorpusculum sp.]|nr:sodium:solute symporter family protein [Methanocorpusculum sp.]